MVAVHKTRYLLLTPEWDSFPIHVQRDMKQLAVVIIQEYHPLIIIARGSLLDIQRPKLIHKRTVHDMSSFENAPNPITESVGALSLSEIGFQLMHLLAPR